MRTHINLPAELIEQVDQLVGKRHRSAFLVVAARERVRREKLLRALEASAGAVNGEDHPEWASSRNVAAWVRRVRRESERRTRRRRG